MSSKKNKLARFGVATKGVVYILIGGLTAMAAFGLGGEKSGSSNALETIANTSYGKILLAITALGLIGYVFYRWYQAFGNTDGEDDKKDIAKRIAYFLSGVFYGFLAYSALQTILGNSSNGQGNSIYDTLMNSDYAIVVVSIIGIGLLIKAGYEFYQAYSGKFREQLDEAEVPSEVQSKILNLGKMGFMARGITVGVMSFLFFRAAYHSSTEKMDKVDAFQFIEENFGPIILGIIALGLLLYGVFMVVSAKYSNLDVG